MEYITSVDKKSKIKQKGRFPREPCFLSDESKILQFTDNDTKLNSHLSVRLQMPHYCEK